MPYTILVFLYRKPGTDRAKFRTMVEDRLMPLLKEILGEHFPLSHTRRYIHRAEGPTADGNTERNPTSPATLFRGSQVDFDYDSIAELVFADEAHFEKVMSIVGSPENVAKLEEFEGTFADTNRAGIVRIGETMVTTKD